MKNKTAMYTEVTEESESSLIPHEIMISEIIEIIDALIGIFGAERKIEFTLTKLEDNSTTPLAIGSGVVEFEQILQIQKEPSYLQPQSPSQPQVISVEDALPDLWLFENMEIHPKCHHFSDDDQIEEMNHAQCTAMRRIVAILNYYNSLIMNGMDHELPILRTQFIEFVDKHYGPLMLLEDYIHCITEHRDPDSITKMTAVLHWKCYDDFKRCTVTPWHYRDRSQDAKNPVHFYMEIMDTMHFNLLHLEDVGLRVNQSLKFENQRNDSDLVDHRLLEMSKRIRQKRQQYPFRRLNSDVKSVKFSLTPTITGDSGNANTPLVLDRVMGDIWQKIKSRPVLDLFHQFVVSHDFDTDAVNEDMIIFEQCGCSHLWMMLQGNVKAFHSIQWSLRYHRVSESSFSTGKWFAYWPWYETQTIESLMTKSTNWWQSIEFGGHSLEDLCVKPYFANLKEEVVCSGILSMFQFTTLIVQKAKLYSQTARCKQKKLRSG